MTVEKARLGTWEAERQQSPNCSDTMETIWKEKTHGSLSAMGTELQFNSLDWYLRRINLGGWIKAEIILISWRKKKWDFIKN